ncbi:putative Mu-like prophage FluMu protein gp46 [Burkholderia diffusa]|uniref:phage GP46 family protein n=1 Tax=Burkholderia diffusa TaxID=488732 RepID=UPI001CB3D9DF|nr:phage GP46 family protein [Burkholderia diffusa]CAG9248590.1 putative Mu-like prophage FluMu protein gp46 [Burkholderia diffusa]
MADITTVWQVPRLLGDWVLAGPSLLSGNDLHTAVLISLFTDRLALPSDPTPDGDRRGWWGDDPLHSIGSRLWLLERVKGPLDVPQRVRDYVAEALQWLLDDGVVARFDIDAQWITPNRVDLSVIANRRDGSRVAMKFPQVWTSSAS